MVISYYKPAGNVPERPPRIPIDGVRVDTSIELSMLALGLV
jgi:hypothetical protein